jgi:hypothetical protein
MFLQKKSNTRLTISLAIAALGAAPMFAQTTPATKPVAYIYVSSPAGIYAASALSNGSLNLISGAPFADQVSSMAVNGKYLMAASNTAADINTYSIGSNGSLTFVASINYAQYNDPTNPCGVASQLFFDHTGSTLYVQEFDGSDACTNDVDASFAVDSSTGALTYLGTDITGAFPGDYTPAYFIGNNVYAYSADQSGCMYPGIYGFQRDSSGLLNNLSITYNQPTPPPGARGYYPDLAVADPTNHVVIIEQPVNPPGCAAGPLQLAVYTADASGNLNTTSTYQDMPTLLIQTPADMKMSPSGKLLAVAGIEGLQIFHFNGANPITRYSGLITKDSIDQMFWDNDNHLYAISNHGGKLFIFTITPTGGEMAPGSPYTITSPHNIIVQPLVGQ